MREDQSKKKRVEKKTTIIQPLVDTGVEIHLRFLERSKQTFRNGRLVQLDDDREVYQAIIEAGNKAAHETNINAVMALFVIGILDLEKVSAFLKDVFDKNPGYYLDNPGSLEKGCLICLYNL